MAASCLARGRPAGGEPQAPEAGKVLQSEGLAHEHGDPGRDGPRIKYVFGVCVLQAHGCDSTATIQPCGLCDPARGSRPVENTS